MWNVFVEGSADKVFLECLLRHLSISHVHTDTIGGEVSALPNVKNEIYKSRDRGDRIAVVLDADSNPSNRRNEFLRMRDTLSIPIDDNHCFLVPNNQDQGDLETLLEQISVPERREVYDCFGRHEECIRMLSDSKAYRPPDRKQRIYTYCWANRIETQPAERDYCDSRYWDLDAGAIEPLKEFLLSLPR